MIPYAIGKQRRQDTPSGACGGNRQARTEGPSDSRIVAPADYSPAAAGAALRRQR